MQKCQWHVDGHLKIAMCKCHTLIHTLLDRKDCTNALLWSKTTLTTGSVGGPGVDPPHRKMNTFFLRSLALSVPIYRYFQSNGGKWRGLKLRKNLFYLIGH